jgi:hypothetical protein
MSKLPAAAEYAQVRHVKYETLLCKEATHVQTSERIVPHSVHFKGSANASKELLTHTHLI